MFQLPAQESIGQRVVRFFEVRADAVDSAVDAGLGFAVKLGSQPSVATRERSAAVSRTACAFASTCGRRGCRQSAGHDFLAFSCPPFLSYIMFLSGVESARNSSANRLWKCSAAILRRVFSSCVVTDRFVRRVSRGLMWAHCWKRSPRTCVMHCADFAGDLCLRSPPS